MKKKLIQLAREENFLSLAGNLVIALFGIASFSLLARSLPVQQFGQWVLFISSGAFIEMFRFGITNSALIRFLSGADKQEREQLLGSNAVISLVTTSLVAALLLLVLLVFPTAINRSDYALFFTWYPLLAFINLPWNIALVVLQADRQYGRILLLKSFNSVSFFIVLISNYFLVSLQPVQLVYVLLVINAGTSVISMVAGWDGLIHFRKATRAASKALFDFGKYTTITLVGTNLLRSADTVIISLSPMGSAAVALYSIPLKLTELQQIPLRSFAATAFPKMSRASIQGKMEDVRHCFYVYAGAITYLFIFVCLGTFVFADFFVLLLAGNKYLGVDAATGVNVATIVRVFSLYGLLLPIDRMTGIGLDSVNKPAVNALKVFYMLVANIVGDIIAIFVFKSLMLVAVASIAFTLVGIYTGMYFLNRELGLHYKKIFTAGADFYTAYLHKFFHRQNKISKA